MFQLLPPNQIFVSFGAPPHYLGTCKKGTKMCVHHRQFLFVIFKSTFSRKPLRNSQRTLNGPLNQGLMFMFLEKVTKNMIILKTTILLIDWCSRERNNAMKSHMHYAGSRMPVHQNRTKSIICRGFNESKI